MADAASTHPPIRLARLDDAAVIADILTGAFQNDPVMHWTFGNARPFRTIYYELARGLYLKSGFGHLVEEGAAALWLPAGVKPHLPILNEFRIGVAALKASGVGVVTRALKINAIMAANHPPTPHYYLFSVGVRDSLKGRGIGGRIIREGLKLAAEDGATAYLENSNPMNTPLYERLGFKPIAPLPLPKGAPPLLAMQTERVAP